MAGIPTSWEDVSKINSADLPSLFPPSSSLSKGNGLRFFEKILLSAKDKELAELFLNELNLSGVFADIQSKYGFQVDNSKNQCEHYRLLVRGRMNKGMWVCDQKYL